MRARNNGQTTDETEIIYTEYISGSDPFPISFFTGDTTLIDCFYIAKGDDMTGAESVK